MEEIKIEALRLDLLYKECESVGSKITTLFVAGEKYLSMAFAIIVAGMAYGIKEHQHDILLLVPFAIMTVMFYAIHMFTEVNALGGYKYYLEEQINIILNKNVLLWECKIAKSRHAAAPIFLYLIYIVFLIIAVVNSLSLAWTFYTTCTFWSVLISHILLLSGLIIEIYRMNSTFTNTYQLSKKVAESATG
jgi:hypothetical protein